ncbi:DUF1129 family protein [Shouchella clausii]|jgi:uncharacterized membrane-anchored protein|uniref:DUF1129 family protein n=1 Tax=Shouchella clausii TaxID=79880 RepID=UPI000B97785E|nr:DUF1129 family protein [Shouchella clausii]AST95731.1 hypothetical protein BC8716_07135 [Shouchella clausii]MCR1289003.1 DUF1129 family protein [Shouchella clausii]MEB5472136.1 DUF1129 family protein [Shouchella clausii]QNM42085.1 DUF1129 family protein [Shouchella clausii]WQG95082.1 DUF1129 family protein [Shouchella clausii]
MFKNNRKEIKALIEENNRLRQRLTPDNLKLYEDMMLYIRTDLRLAEYESEQILMEMLHHIVDSQKDGKTAKDVFGGNPKDYAEELIAELPREKKRNVAQFIIAQVVVLIGIVCLVEGLGKLVLPLFGLKGPVVITGNLMVTLLMGIIGTGVAVYWIFKQIRKDLFTEGTNSKKQYIKTGLIGAVAFMAMVGIVYLLPDWGIPLTFAWWTYVLIGMFLLIIGKRLQAA